VKRLNVIFGIILVLFIFAYFRYSDGINRGFYFKYKEFIPEKLSFEKIVFIEDNFSLGDYSALFEAISGAEGSVALLMPQVFNIRVGDYLENIEPADIKKTQEEYREFSIKLAEARNILPVVFLSGESMNNNDIDLSSSAYFKSKETGLKLPVYSHARVKSRRLWMSVPDKGFYPDYSSYPREVPLFMDYKGSALANAAVEALRRYYKLPKSSVKITERRVEIGNIIKQQMLPGGTVMLYPVKSAPVIYTMKDMPPSGSPELRDKIIIISSTNVPRDAMLSMGACLFGIMESAFLKHNRAANYLAALLCCLLFLVFYLRLKPLYGAVLFVLSLVSALIICALLFSAGIYTEFAVIMAALTAPFTGVYYYRLAFMAAENKRRREALLRIVHPDEVGRYMKNSLDIKMKNTWIKAVAAYFIFEPGFAGNPENLKIVFETIRDIVYNKTKDFIITLSGTEEIAVILLTEKETRRFFEALIEIRENSGVGPFNVVLSSSEIYMHDFNGAVVFGDRNHGLAAECALMDKKRYIIVPEKDIQKYMGIIKFQKITGAGKTNLYNTAGIREDA